MMKWILYLYISIFSVTAFSQESPPPKILNSADYRERSSGTVMAGYQFLTNWIPFKWTLGYSYLFNQKWSAEIEWSRGSYGIGAFGFDAARVTENRYSLIARRYVGNSFHFIMGGFKSDLHGELGDSMLKKMTDTSVDDFRVQGVGVALGLGNRWQWNNGLTLGVDWFRLNVPLIYKKVDNGVLDGISDSNDLSIVKDSIQKVKNLPTIVLFGLHLGYSF
jgi:hypothetical protein